MAPWNKSKKDKKNKSEEESVESGDASASSEEYSEYESSSAPPPTKGSSAKRKAAGAVSSVATKVNLGWREGNEWAKKSETLKTLDKEVKKAGSKGKAKVGGALGHIFYEIAGNIELAMEQVVSSSLDKVKDIAKDKVKDPEMPMFVQNGIDDIIESAYPDIKEEAMDEIMAGARTKIPIKHGEVPNWCPNPYYRIRAFILYTLFPFDKGIWHQIKDPWYIIFSLISFFPFYGVSQLYFLFIFFLKDGGDEYQLVQYILNFKSMQFITVGVLPAMVAGVQYYFCATFHSAPDQSTCDQSGPRVLYWTMMFFALQVVLVYVAALRLPCSKRKGGRQYLVRGTFQAQFDTDGDGVLDEDEIRQMRKYMREHGMSTKALEDDDVEITLPGQRYCCCKCYARRGGSLRRFVLYDLFCFILVAALSLLAIYMTPVTKVEGSLESELPAAWQLNTTLYWCQTLYGFLSVPFVLFKLPLMARVLTHAKPTAYNYAGETVPVQKPDPPEKDVEEGEEDPNAAHKAVAEIRKMTDTLKSFSGGAKKKVTGRKADKVSDGEYSE